MPAPIPPPKEHARRIVQAIDNYRKARVARDEAIAEALKAGGSVREVAAIAGMSASQVTKIGHDNGWPTAKQKREWADRQAENQRWRDAVAAYRRQGGTED